MGQKAFDYDPVGWSGIDSPAGENHSSAPMSFSSPGAADEGRNVGNEADSYCHPHASTPAGGPSYDKDMYEAANTTRGMDFVPPCDRDLDYGND